MIIRIPRAGDMPISAKGTPGDLLVRVNVSPSNAFRRQGTNLYHDAKIPFTTALLGGKVRVPTLDGEVDVRVPSGTQPGQEAVLKGRGVPNMYSRNVGDLYVTFGVQLPRYAARSGLHRLLNWRPVMLITLRGRSLTAKQRAILQQLADDLEGRTPTSSGTPPTPVADTNKPSSEEPASELNSSTGNETEGKYNFF
jgi:molecular chaperone DnaJ